MQLKITRGFTLIELMIVVAIISILAAIAIPSYKNFLYKSRRSDGQSLLMTAQMAQERYRTVNTSYASTAGDLGISSTSESGYYTLGISDVGPATYTLTATAIGAQASDSSCPTITLTSAGVKGPSESCWTK